jgi:hypothetical protein
MDPLPSAESCHHIGHARAVVGRFCFLYIFGGRKKLYTNEERSNRTRSRGPHFVAADAERSTLAYYNALASTADAGERRLGEGST